MKIQNYEWVDSLRVLATFSVIILHVAARLAVQYGKISDSEWWTANIYDSIVRFCVPIFLMISGTVIFSKTYISTKYFLQKRLARIVWPFLFWTFIYIFKDLFFQFVQGEPLTVVNILSFILIQFKEGASVHLWFVYMIIGLYLFFPIVAKWIHNSERRDIEYFLILWVAIMILNLLALQSLVKQFHLIYYSGFIGYPILGYYLTNFKAILERKILLFSAALLGISISAVGTFILTQRDGIFNEFFFKYLTPNVLMVSCAVFLYFKNWVNVSGWLKKMIIFLSKYSYGIFLVHMLVLWVIEIKLKNVLIDPVVGIPLISSLCLAGIIYILHKIPYGKYVAG
ncbi:acyltransferase [Kaistella palustris]|uniref:acyltransferase n=1 Tax=Kaistella palustris TaxID=493376 RepID=UPI00146DE16F|nr:acyltransferase family protein [Kaistella palustris]